MTGERIEPLGTVPLLPPLSVDGVFRLDIQTCFVTKGPATIHTGVVYESGHERVVDGAVSMEHSISFRWQRLPCRERVPVHPMWQRWHKTGVVESFVAQSGVLVATLCTA